MTDLPLVILLMGVSGSGKSALGRALADRLDRPFFDGDDFHPPANIQKMSAGSPLTDHDRLPWLARLRQLIDDHLASAQPMILACSALKKSYRDQLATDRPEIALIHLHGTRDLLAARLTARTDHFFKPAMLDSQLATLEPPDPDHALILEISHPIDQLIEQILAHF